MTPTQPAVGTVPLDVPAFTQETVVAKLARPQADEKTTIAIVADPHIATQAQGTWKRFDLTEQWLKRAVTAINNSDIDGVAVLGDLTKDGEPYNFDRFDELVATLDAPLVTVPGNHDSPKSIDKYEGLSTTEFCDRYAPNGYPVAEQLGSIDLIGLNTAIHPDGLHHDNHGGSVPELQRQALDRKLRSSNAPVVIMHHNLYELPHNPGGSWSTFPVDNPEPLHNTLVKNGAKLVLSGHQHLIGTKSRSGVREILVPALCSYPHSILTLEVGPHGTTIRLLPLATSQEVQAAYEASINDTPMGRGIAARAGIALESLPLVDEQTSRR